MDFDKSKKSRIVQSIKRHGPLSLHKLDISGKATMYAVTVVVEVLKLCDIGATADVPFSEVSEQFANECRIFHGKREFPKTEAPCPLKRERSPCAAPHVGVGPKIEIKRESEEVPRVAAERARRAFCESCSGSKLVSMMLKHDHNCKQLERQLEEIRKRSEAWKKLAHKLKAKWMLVRKQHRKSNKGNKKRGDQYHKGKGLRAQLSSWGGITIALHRCLGALGGWRMACLQTDVSRWTVNRWEAVVSNCITQHHREYVTASEEQLRRPGCPHKQWGVRTVMVDGTNKTVLRKQSVAVPRLLPSGD